MSYRGCVMNYRSTVVHSEASAHLIRKPYMAASTQFHMRNVTRVRSAAKQSHIASYCQHLHRNLYDYHNWLRFLLVPSLTFLFIQCLTFLFIPSLTFLFIPCLTFPSNPSLTFLFIQCLTFLFILCLTFLFIPCLTFLFIPV